jgi:hypothetical protein
MLNRICHTFRILGLVVSILNVACNDSNNPIKSGKLRGYSAYFCEYDYDYEQAYVCYKYNPCLDEIDTVSLPVYPQKTLGLTVSADGERLYILRASTVVLIDIKSGEILKVFNYDVRQVVVSPDGELVAFLVAELKIFRTSDFLPVFHDTVNIYNGRFAKNSHTLFASVWDDENLRFNAYWVKLQDENQITIKMFPSDALAFSTAGVVPSVDEDKLFLYMKFNSYDYLFSVYDVTSDSIIYNDYLTPGLGYIYPTSDGKLVFYTNPGGFISGVPPSYSFCVYDVETNQFLKEINARLVFNETDTVYCPTHDLYITPDDKWVVGLSFFGHDAIFALNTETMEIEKKHALGGNRWLSGLSGQISF